MVKRARLKKPSNSALQRLWSDFRESESVEARNALIEFHLSIVSKVARVLHSRMPRSVELGDLEGAGYGGLIQAVENFDPDRGVPFEAFCQHRIRGAILDGCRTSDWLPRPMRNKLNARRDAIEELRTNLEREPSDQEVAEKMNMALEDYQRQFAPGMDAPVLAVGKPGSGNGDGEAGLDFLEDQQDEGPLEDVHLREMVELIASTLDREAREILFKRFFEARTLKEIGDELAISQSRVSKILGRHLERLKERFEDKVV
ncbi:MAG TPA: hypothetical protein DDW23_07520 [Planctomycetes bacterium]|nr:hypothetical protein [Planctomycetota bacterium]